MVVRSASEVSNPHELLARHGFDVDGIVVDTPGVFRLEWAVDHFRSEYRLTTRQQQILPLLLRGMSNESIGAMLGIARCTVKSHVATLWDRTGVNSRNELLRALFKEP